MKTSPSQKDLRRRKLTEDDRIIMSLRTLFEDYYYNEIKYTDKKGEVHKYTHKTLKTSSVNHRKLTQEELEYIKTHSAVDIAKHFNKSTTWAYNRIAGADTL